MNKLAVKLIRRIIKFCENNIKDFNTNNIYECKCKIKHDNNRTIDTIDKYIQKLFKRKEIKIIDYYSSKKANIVLFDKVSNKLKKEYNTKEFIFNRDRLLITLKKDV